MFNLVAYSSSIALSANYANVSAVVDQAQTTSANNKYIFPANQKVKAACIVGADIVAARLNTPSLRAFILPELDPTNVGAAVPSRPGVIVFGDDGPTLLRNEEVAIEISRGAVAAAQNTAGIWVSDKPMIVQRGPQFCLTATFTNTLLAYGWSLSPLTFSQTLPAGDYAVVGLRTVCASAIFGRLVFPGTPQYRPGCVNDVLYTNLVQPDYFRRGELGLWGKFTSTAQPQIEMFGAAAGAQSGTAYLDLVKL